jgi:hypothetical protein
MGDVIQPKKQPRGGVGRYIVEMLEVTRCILLTAAKYGSREP